jgi:hypothetical protein
MRLQLFDQGPARRRAESDAKNAAGKLVKAVNGQRLEFAISRRQRSSRYAWLPGFEFAGQEVGKDAQGGKVAIDCRHGDEAGTFIDNRQRGIKEEQPDARMNPPAGAAIQRGGMAAKQPQRLPRIAEQLMRFTQNHAPDADAPGQDPLFGPRLGGAGMPLQQPMQEGLAFVFGAGIIHQRKHGLDLAKIKPIVRDFGLRLP